MTLREGSMAPAWRRSARPGDARRGSDAGHYPGAEHSCWPAQPRAHWEHYPHPVRARALDRLPQTCACADENTETQRVERFMRVRPSNE